MRTLVCILACLGAAGLTVAEEPASTMNANQTSAAPVWPGADEASPSRAQYFSWINNTNEGATEAQTLANLAFFRWLHDEYGMVLDIYAFDAGAIDGPRRYGSMDSPRFARQFPRGFGPLVEAAGQMGTRLGLWAGPDGFGDTPDEQARRIELMVSLCRDHRFALFKFDQVCGRLRPEKQDAFIEMMQGCRQYSPDLIALNHRLRLDKAQAYVTTSLLEDTESYIDVHLVNATPAPHSRAGAVARPLPAGLKRLSEDHGVCLSSCLDYWEDDLVLQAFNRGLILAPEIYGNPWLLRDDEFPRLARLFNLHRRYRDILVAGMVLPEEPYGPDAVSRGDGATRLITLRNLTWQPRRVSVRLDETIGLTERGAVEVRRLHPGERIVGRFEHSQTVEVEVLPFRACLVLATTQAELAGVGAVGCDYEVVRDVPGRPVVLKLQAPPGSEAEVRVQTGGRPFTRATLEGQAAPALLHGEPVRVDFAGPPLRQAWHRKLGDLLPVDVPADAESLYEATCFAADSNALEVRELLRSGPTRIPQVRAAREAFLNQSVFRGRNLWDRYLFDGDPTTGLAVSRRGPGEAAIRGGAFRLDLGQPTRIDTLVLEVGDDYALQPNKPGHVYRGSVSADLKNWTPVTFFAEPDMSADLPIETPTRYIRLDNGPDLIRGVRGYWRGEPLATDGWRASNLLGRYSSAPAVQAWSLKFTLDEAPVGGYLAIPIFGRCGNELAYAAVRVGEDYAGAPRRSPSYPCNPWEYPVRAVEGNYTYCVPVTAGMVGKPLEIFVLLLRGGNADIRCEAWLTAYPIPQAGRELVLTENEAE